MPKGLVDTGDGPWVLRALDTLAGLPETLVVVGASAADMTMVLPPHVRTVHNPDHAAGMGSSLVVGLRSLDAGVDGAVIMLVDLPDVPRAAVDRIVSMVRSARDPRHTLARATYHGRPGHPVFLGADHIAGVIEAATGDRGARDYLAGRTVTAVECGDLADGFDVDRPPAAPPHYDADR